MTYLSVPVGDYIVVPEMHQDDWLPLPTTKEIFLLWVEKNQLDDSAKLQCNIVRQYQIKK